MANQSDIEAMYDWVDRLHTMRLGDHTDFTAAFYNGDYSLSLKEAQDAKHAMILDGVHFKKGDRVLDIGSGWGPILARVKEGGGDSVGLTLSTAQRKYCLQRGLDVRLQDWKETAVADIGVFDAVVSVGAFEHFCSPQEYLDGKQEEIYKNFFEFCASVLPGGGRLFLQTMTWGNKIPRYQDFNLSAPEGTPEKILARLEKFYPGSWLPDGLEQIKTLASEHFEFVSSNNGRLDYIQTLKEWHAHNINLWTRENCMQTIRVIASLVPRYVLDTDFRIQLSSIRHGDQTQCFVDEIMSHERMFFQKR